MGIFSGDKGSRLRGFFEKSGILFPKGKRAPGDRRTTGSVDYLAVDAEVEDRRVNNERRDDESGGSPLDGML